MQTEETKQIAQDDEKQRFIQRELLLVNGLIKNLETKESNSKSLKAFSDSILSHYFSIPSPVYHLDLFNALLALRTQLNGTYQAIAIAEPRGFGKSTKMMSFILHSILTEQRHFIINVSSTHREAVRLLQPVREELEGNELIHAIYGDWTSEKWSEDDFEVKNKKTGFRCKVIAKGAEEQIRGLKFLNYRPDLVVLDDIESREEADSMDRRNNLEHWLNLDVEKCLSKEGWLVLVGTILHEDSVLARVLKGGSKYATWHRSKFRALEHEKSVWPEHRSTDSLITERAKDPFSFSQELMNYPIPLEHQTFRREDFLYYDELPKVLDVYIPMDFASTEKETSDFTVIMSVGVDPDGKWYILEYTRVRWGDQAKVIGEIFRLVEKWKTSEFNFRSAGMQKVDYSKWIGRTLEVEMRKRNQHFLINQLKADRDKARHIGQLHPYFRNHSILHRPVHIELEEELLMFPKATHDDVDDTLAMMINMVASPPKPVVKKPSVATGSFLWWRNKTKNYYNFRGNYANRKFTDQEVFEQVPGKVREQKEAVHYSERLS